jgi:hypothetical protein
MVVGESDKTPESALQCEKKLDWIRFAEPTANNMQALFKHQ